MANKFFQIPTTLCNAVAANAGVDMAITVAEATLALPKGWYKIAAVATPIRWRLGATAVTNAIGSYLAAGDQELIWVGGNAGVNGTLRAIRSRDAVADGWLNVVPVILTSVPGEDPRNYDDP